ncbi:hypothetical protein TWF594_001377 [Orbilia oligospora]|nr:hypothetical protein TWF594_001377 [Orbilia oligospora]
MSIKYEESGTTYSAVPLQDPGSPNLNDENENENENENDNPQLPTPSSSPTKKASTPSKRGRPAGVSSAFTPEQDAYLIHLRQKSSKVDDIWVDFEKKFHSGKSSKDLKNRWFAIKDSVLLSGDEDKLLMETIEEVIGDIAASIVEKFKGKSGKKVTKAYVQKKMKERKGKTKKETGL